MKVALLAPYLSRASGGLSHSIPGLVAALEARGDCEPHVVGVLDGRHPDDWREWGRRVHPVKAAGPRAFGWGPSMHRRLRTVLPDIVDIQGLWMYPSLVNLEYTRSTSTPYIVTPRGMLDPWALHRSVWKKRIVRWWYENAHLRKANCIRATALLEFGHVRAFGMRQPVAVVPNAVDLPLEMPRPPCRTGRRRLLFLSRLHPKKGLPFLLRAWGKLAFRHEQWELVIAGPDEVGHRAAMGTLAAELHLPRLTWLDAVVGDEKDALYRSADLFVLPTHGENFGLVVAEALAHGVPVVTSRHAPWEGVRSHGCGWWVELGEPSLIEALDEAMRLPAETRAAMGACGRAWIQREFAWPTIAHQLLEVYRWAIGGGQPPSCVLTD